MQIQHFENIIAALNHAFGIPVTMNDYIMLVDCVRQYGLNRAEKEDEVVVLRKYGFPESYHPCDHIENLRFGLCFTCDKSDRLHKFLVGDQKFYTSADTTR